MIILFTSKGCKSCDNILVRLTDEWKKKILILEVRYDNKTKVYRVYSKEGEQIGEEAPIMSVPTLYFLEKEKVYTGYNAIIKRLDDEQ